MKKAILLSLMALTHLSSCEEKQRGDKEISIQAISETWLVVSEERASDNWTQSDENGIATDWKIINPFSNDGLRATSIKFNADGTFFWNADQILDWEDFMKIWNDMPREKWSTYDLHNNGTLTLYTTFEYVGIIKVDTTEFQARLQNDMLTLENDDVRLGLKLLQ